MHMRLKLSLTEGISIRAPRAGGDLIVYGTIWDLTISIRAPVLEAMATSTAFS